MNQGCSRREGDGAGEKRIIDNSGLHLTNNLLLVGMGKREGEGLLKRFLMSLFFVFLFFFVFFLLFFSKPFHSQMYKVWTMVQTLRRPLPRHHNEEEAAWHF